MDQISSASDSFGPVSLSRFAAAPTSAHLLRAQHETLSRQMDAIAFEAHSFGGDSQDERAQRALDVSNALTSLKAFLVIHQTLEAGLMHKILATDPRHRLLAEQYEREAMTVLSAYDKLLMTFSSPSIIFGAFSAFSEESAPVFIAIKERFKAEERDLFSVFDRIVSSNLHQGGQPAAERAPLASADTAAPSFEGVGGIAFDPPPAAGPGQELESGLATVD